MGRRSATEDGEQRAGVREREPLIAARPDAELLRRDLGQMPQEGHDLPELVLFVRRPEGLRLALLTLELFREPLGPEAEDLVARVVALQDHLGELNDADVAAGLTRKFLLAASDELDAREREAIGRYLVHSEREVARLRRTVGRPWRRIEGVTFRRALGRALARL